ncbi:MAG: class I SAM-dependent methyltransferase family protein [Phycisphaerae bacterium]|jgi:SAM-dependent methyltransferase|nr:class I SAM-dependent methyltransferase family protein [Phycisphaerae bacterium]
MDQNEEIHSWVTDLEFERVGPVKRALKRAVLNPLVNYIPAVAMKSVLRFSKSELAQANWTDPGGWKSMVISYHGKPRQIADKFMVNGGAMSMALRNRRRLAARMLSKLIEQADSAGDKPVHALCLGAGPGRIIIDALLEAPASSHATLVDISSDAFEYGRQLAESCGVGDRVKYVQGDVRDVKDVLDPPPVVVKMIGICEYLTDEQIADIAQSLADVMAPGGSIVFNSISTAHGTDRFFRRVMGLHMIHRSPEQLSALLAQAGFGDFVSIPEPLDVYHVIVGRLKGN